MSRGYLQIVQLNTDCKNGKVYVYLAGGTNLAEIYDPVSGDEITNPVNINSLGYCDAFLVDTATLYDIKVVDFLGAPKLTRMNVSVIGGGAGTAGPQGNQGRPGDKGDKGDKGDTGAAGTDGTNGTDGTDGTDGVSLLNIRVDETSSTGRVIYTKSDDPNNWIEAGDIMPAGIGQVKTTGLDTLGYLDEKIEVTGTGLGLSNTNNKITLENTAPETFKTQASQYSTVNAFLNMIIEGTRGITVSTSADFNKIVLSGAGIGGSGFTPRGAWDAAITYNEGDGVWYYDDSVSPIINRYYVATATTTGVNPYNVGTGWIIMFSIDQLGDQMVKLDADDSTTSFLLDKIKAGDGIVFTRTFAAGGDYITVSGQQVFTVTTTNGSHTINELSHDIKFRDGVWTNPAYIGTEIAIEHKSIAQMEGQTTPMFTATGLPKFDDYGHYMNASDPIEISDVAGLADAIVAAGDGKVKIDGADTKDYLINKLSAGTGINITDAGNTLEISADLAESSAFFFKSNYNDAGNSGYVAIDQVVFGNQYIDAPNHKIHNLPLGKLLLSTNLKATSNFGNFDYSEDCYSGTTGTQVYIIGENNPLVKFGSNQFGTWTEYQSKSTGYSSQPFWSGYTRRVVEVAGKQLVNLGCNLYSKQNGNGGVTLYLKHYNSLGTLKTNYPVDEGDWTNLNYQEPSLAQYRQLSKSFVIDCEESDYFSVELRVRGDGANNTDIMSGSYVKNITLSGALLSGNQYNFPIAQVNTFVTQYSSSGAVKNYYDHKYAFSEYTNESSCKTYLIDMAVGDYITLTYSAGNYVADVQYEVHGLMCGGGGGGGGGGADTYTVKADADDTTPSYLGDKIAAAAGSPISVNVVNDTLILDVIESDITDPLIQTIGLMNENGTMGFTGNAYSSVYADGDWATGFGQNTSDAYYRVSTIGRGTINKVKFFVNAYNDVDYGISPTGNYGAIRIGLFDLNGVCKGQTEWTRGLQTLGTVTLTMTPCDGQNLTLERNGEYWIGIVSRGMQLISYNKAASGFDPMTNALRYSVSIRSSSSGADWSPNFWNTTGGGFIQVKVPCVFMASTD